MYIIEDELHADWQGEFETLEDAVAELQRRATIPWDQSPNRAPCVGWKTCGRQYEVVEFDVTVSPWRERRRIPALDVSADGTRWRAFVPPGAGSHD